MFAEKPYEQIFVEDIAARAGASRALLYHYFPSKRDLYVAIFKRASSRLLARANPDPQLPLAEQLANGLGAHIQYFADHPFEAIAINRGALSDDPAILAVMTGELNVVGRRLVDKLVTEGHCRDFTEIAIEGWLAFVRAACVRWIESREITRPLSPKCVFAPSSAPLGAPTWRSHARNSLITLAPSNYWPCRRSQHSIRHRGRATTNLSSGGAQIVGLTVTKGCKPSCSGARQQRPPQPHGTARRAAAKHTSFRRRMQRGDQPIPQSIPQHFQTRPAPAQRDKLYRPS